MNSESKAQEELDSKIMLLTEVQKFACRNCEKEVNSFTISKKTERKDYAIVGFCEDCHTPHFADTKHTTVIRE